MPITKLKQSPRGLSATRSIQKAVLTTSSTQQLKRTNAKASTIASAVGSASLASLATAAAGSSSNNQNQLLNNSSSSSSLDPLVVLKCDAAHARSVTHLHLARRSLTSLHPNLMLFINLEELWLNDNNLTELVGIAPCPETHHLAVPSGCLRLKRLFLSRNRFTSFPANNSDLARLPHLEVLLLADNRLTNLELISQQLSCLVNLRQLDLSGNPLAEERGYREYIIAHHPTLEVLDRHTITDVEREKALRMYPPVQVSRSKGSAAALDRVAFGTCRSSSSLNQQNGNNNISSNYLNKTNLNLDNDDGMSTSYNYSPASFGRRSQQQQQNNHQNQSPSSFRGGAGLMLDNSSSVVNLNTAGRRNNKSQKKNPFMSQMAEVLEIRANNVRHKRRVEEENVKMHEEREFQACANLQESFHKAWNDAVVKNIQQQHQKQVDAVLLQQQQQQQLQNEKGGKQRGGAGAAGQENLALPPPPPQPTLILPPLQRGVVPTMFSNDNNNKKSLSDPLSILTMERDPTVFAKCLTDATKDEERKKKYKQAEEACLSSSEVSAIHSSFPLADAKSTATSGTNPTYAVKDICKKLMEILNINDQQKKYSKKNDAVTIITEASLTKHFLSSEVVRHGRMEGGENILRLLLEFGDFVGLRTEILYSQSNDVVRTKPEEAVQMLRKISTLQDFGKYLSSSA